MTQPAFRPLSVGEILDQSFGLYRRHLPVLVTIALVCTALPQIALAAVTINAVTLQAIIAILPRYLAVGLVLLIGSQLAVGASTLVLSEGYLGRTITTGQALKRAWSAIGRIVVLGMLTSLILGLGFAMLIIPGIILLSGLAVSTPALMIEPGLNAGGAMSRSWELTRGSRMRMLVLLIVPTVIIMVIVFGFAATIGLLMAGAGAFKEATATDPSLGFRIFTQAISLVSRTFLLPLLYCVITVAYFDLRVRTEGFDLEVLATTLTGTG
jgi:hypothetical protein